jgi:membrane associated rhomboid family serine protease
VARGSALPYAALMKSPTPLAGGFFLVLPIVVGFAWGLTEGRAMQGAVAGLCLGLLLAALVWLIDRLRQRR